MSSATVASVSVVLVHGGFVDGSGWEKVYQSLKKDGYSVSVVQNPTKSLADDVAFTKRIIDAQSSPVILVGHSYGGVVITQAGNHAKVVGLVYVAAFVPDSGESVSSLIKDPPPGAPVPPILPPQDGYLFSTRRSSPLRSPRMWIRQLPCSWRILRCPGESTPSRARSIHPPGNRSRTGTS